MASIFELRYGQQQLPSPWRRDWKPASFKGARFYCDANTRESGRRFVEHEFPKKTLPYAEDMGRRAKSFTLRGHIVVFPYDSDDETNQLHRMDYRTARDKLRDALESEGVGQLEFSTVKTAEFVLCSGYKLTEEDRFGGYCTFDMSFMEAGIDWLQSTVDVDTTGALIDIADQTIQRGIKELDALKKLSDATLATGM